MATENRGVMVYLPPDIEEYITQYCTQYDITRRSKDGEEPVVSLGSGVLAYLKEQILGTEPIVRSVVPRTIPSNALGEDEVRSLIAESLGPIDVALAELQSAVPELVARVGVLEAGKKAAPPKPVATEVTPTTDRQEAAAKVTVNRDNLDKATLGRLEALEADPKLRAALQEAIAKGLANGAIALELADKGFTTTKGTPHDASAITRFKRALEVLQQEEEAEAL